MGLIVGEYGIICSSITCAVLRGSAVSAVCTKKPRSLSANVLRSFFKPVVLLDLLLAKVHNRGECPTPYISCRPSLAQVHDLSVVLIHECETLCAAISTSSAAYACVSRFLLYTRHERELYLCYSDLFTPT